MANQRLSSDVRPPRSRWPWWKRALAGAGLLLLLLLVCYQPILTTLVPLVAQQVGKKEHLQISLKLGGTIFTGLRVENLAITPTAAGPIEKCNVGLLELHYSLPTLLRHGLNSAFIEDVTLHDADIVYDPSLAPPSPPKKKEPFSLPPLPLPTRLSLRNINFLLRSASPETAKAAGQSAAASSNVPAPVAPVVSGATTAAVNQGLLVSGLNLDLDPDRAGELSFAEVRIPAGPDLQNVKAATSYRERDLQIAGLALAPEIRFRTLTIDGSKLEQQLLTVALDGDFFQGRADATIQLQGIGTPPKASVQVHASGISLASVHDFLKLASPLSGAVDAVSVSFDGASDQPKTWLGRVSVHVAQPAFGTTTLDSVALELGLKDSALDLEQADVVAGANTVALRARIDLPAKMADLPRSSGSGTIKITAPDFTKLPVSLPVTLAGAFQAGGDFGLADGKVTANLKGHIADFSAPAQHASVVGIDFGVTLSKTLPAGATAPPVAPNAPPPPVKPFFDGLQTHVAASVDGLAYGDYRIDGVKVALGTDEANVKLESIEVTRGENRVDVNGAYQLPADFAAWRQNPLDVNLTVAAPRLSEFAVTPVGAQPALEGQLQAKGNVALRQGEYGGEFDLNAQNVQASGARLDAADVQIGIEHSQASIRSGAIRFDDKNGIQLTGHAALAAPYTFDGGATVDLPDLSRFEPILRAHNLNTPISGAVRVVANGKGQLASQPGANDQHITGSVDVTARDVHAQGAQIPSVDTHIDIENNHAVIKTGQIQLDAKSGITFSGEADLSAPYAYQGTLNADLPDLATFEPILRANNIGGKLAGAVHLAAQAQGHAATSPQANDQALDGKVDLTASKLEAKGVKIDSVNGHIVAANGRAFIQQFQIRFNDKNTIDLAADAGIAAPFDYHANLNVQLLDLKAFEPALRAATAQAGPAASEKLASAVQGPKPVEVNGRGSEKIPGKRAATAVASTRAGKVGVAARTAKPGAPLAAIPSTAPPPEPKLSGAVQVQWQAQGAFPKDGSPVQFSGGGKILAHQVEFNAAGPIEADVEGKYTQDAIDFPTIFASSNGIELRSTLGLQNALARIDNIHLRQGQMELLSGYVQVPLDLKKLSAPEGPVPDVDKIDINIASKTLSLADLFAGIDKSKPSPVLGNVELSVLAHGSVSKILAEVKLKARDLTSPSVHGIPVADADFDLTLRDDRLTLDTSIHQPQLAPLTIKGNIPLDLRAIVSNHQLDPKSPVSLAIELPRSNLAFLAKAVPAVRFIEGDAMTDIRIGGTVAQPVFTGLAEVNVPAVRAQNITVPAIRDLKVRLNFAEKQLRFEQCSGDIGGGKFSLDGHVDFANLTEPVLQLAAKADNVLAVRDDDATVRVNADIHVTGPLAAATVAGSVGITKSRYLKDIDIVPLNLPGKPAPAPPAPAGGEPSIAINTPPLNNWKFNLTIKTDDPFFIRGNLATGKADVDLTLRGTGAAPLLDGNVTIANLAATLPFSRLEFTNGNIYFSADQPLNPVVDLQGTSTIQTYIVTVYVSGRAKSPTVEFTSEPPLPQEQIVALLATGSTTQDLSGNSEALAGKATLLVIQDLYRRFSKKKATPETEPRETLADRVNLDLGAVDPQTGKQEVSARFKITDRFAFIGQFGVEGDLNGSVKYLVRFR